MPGHCPVCNNVIESVFGMIQCSQCQSVLFVDFSGNIVVGDNNFQEQPLPENENFSVKNEELNLKSELTSQKLDEPEYESEPKSETDSSSEFEPKSESEAYEFAEVISDAVAEEDTNALNDIELTSNEYSQIVNESTDLPSWGENPSIPESEFNENFEFKEEKMEKSNVIDLSSNSEQVGSMIYKINIKGIDSAKLRQSVIHTLQDKRLGLVGDEIKERIDKGQLVITGLNPVKANVIMKTLKEYPLEIDWELYGKNEA